MAVDVLSRKDQVPIVAGDLADMKDYRRSAFHEDERGPALILSDGRDASQRLPISQEAAQNLAGSRYVLLVALSETDTIVHAYLSPLGDDQSPVRTLNEEEIKKLAEDLVSGDFNLDFVR